MSFEILVVDDNLLQASTRKAILSALGVRIQVTEDSREALALLTEPEVQDCVRVLVTDHVMPIMAGPELVRRVREILPHLPVLVITGDPDASCFYQNLDVLFELKPVPPDVLIKTVRSLMAAEVRRTA